MEGGGSESKGGPQKKLQSKGWKLEIVVQTCITHGTHVDPFRCVW